PPGCATTRTIGQRYPRPFARPSGRPVGGARLPTRGAPPFLALGVSNLTRLRGPVFTRFALWPASCRFLLGPPRSLCYQPPLRIGRAGRSRRLVVAPGFPPP